MPPPPSTPTEVPSLEIVTTYLQTLAPYMNIARAYCILYLTPCLPLVTPAIYSLTFIILCYLFRRTLLYFHYPPAQSCSVWTDKQAHRMAAPYEIQTDQACFSPQYRQIQSQESEEDPDDSSLWARLFACCASRPSEREPVPSKSLFQ